jgi:hypothetical protein
MFASLHGALIALGIDLLTNILRQTLVLLVLAFVTDVSLLDPALNLKSGVKSEKLQFLMWMDMA